VIERPASRDDLRAVVDLFCAYDVAFRGGPDTDDADFTDDWDKPGFDWSASTLVLADASRLVGFGTVVDEYADVMTAADRTDLVPRLLEIAPATRRCQRAAGGPRAGSGGCGGSWTAPPPSRGGRTA
jgi:hypothetical protein